MRLSTRLRSSVMGVMASKRLLNLRQGTARRRRERRGEAPEILYFHQVDDPYSLIMLQQLSRFASHTTLPIRPYLVSGPGSAFQGDAGRFAGWALNDASNIAGFLGESLPIPSGQTAPTTPHCNQVAIANSILSDFLASPDFFHQAHKQGQALWRHEDLGAGAAVGASTGGDLLDQERKLAQSGLGEFFDGVEIVSNKTKEIYQSAFARYGTGPKAALMVGNSMKSDVIPASAAGAWGVHVPYGLEWALEAAAPPSEASRFRTIQALNALPSLLSALG